MIWGTGVAFFQALGRGRREERGDQWTRNKRDLQMTTYFLQNNESIPLTTEDVQALLDDGCLQAENLLRRDSDQVFIRIDKFPEFAAINVGEREKNRFASPPNAEVLRLTSVLKDGDDRERQRALVALKSIGPAAAAAVPLIVEAIKVDSLCWAATEALGHIGGDDAAKALAHALVHDSDGSVQSRAAGGLGLIGDPAYVPILIQALRHRSEWLRASASEALGDIGDRRAESALREALNDPHETVRKVAGKALKKLLDGCSAHDSLPNARSSAQNTSVDVVDGSRPKWQHADPNIRRAAVETLTDQTLLAGIALNDENHGVIEAAVARVSDQNVLADIAKGEAKRDLACKLAVARVSDPKLLAVVARTAQYSSAKMVALRRVTDQNVLVDIAKNDRTRDVRVRAVEGVVDQNVLADLAQHDKDGDIRTAAVARVTNQKVLVEIAKQDPLWVIRMTVVARVTDPNVLADIAKNDDMRGVRKAAVSRVTNQGVLEDIAKNDEDADVRNAAMAKMNR